MSVGGYLFESIALGFRRIQDRTLKLPYRTGSRALCMYGALSLVQIAIPAQKKTKIHAWYDFDCRKQSKEPRSCQTEWSWARHVLDFSTLGLASGGIRLCKT